MSTRIAAGYPSHFILPVDVIYAIMAMTDAVVWPVRGHWNCAVFVKTNDMPVVVDWPLVLWNKFLR